MLNPEISDNNNDNRKLTFNLVFIYGKCEGTLISKRCESNELFRFLRNMYSSKASKILRTS